MRKLIIATFFAVCTLYVGAASALTPSAAVLVGNGFQDGYNVGLGARGGITLPMSVYVGGTFVYHLGKSESTPAGDMSLNVWYFGGEGGYDLGVGPLTLRPYLGVGYGHVRLAAPDVCALGQCFSASDSTGKLALWPGAAALFGLGGLFVGADLRYVLLLDTDDGNAFSVFATLGTSF